MTGRYERGYERFFALPEAMKSRWPFDKTRNAGWESLTQLRPSTGTPDQKESFQITLRGWTGSGPPPTNSPTSGHSWWASRPRAGRSPCASSSASPPSSVSMPTSSAGPTARRSPTTPVEPAGERITCNIGDMLMRWSEDQLVSNFHRVKSPPEGTADRYSIAFFAQANRGAIIDGPSGKYPAIAAGDYLQQRITPNFTPR